MVFTRLSSAEFPIPRSPAHLHMQLHYEDLIPLQQRTWLAEHPSIPSIGHGSALKSALDALKGEPEMEWIQHDWPSSGFVMADLAALLYWQSALADVDCDACFAADMKNATGHSMLLNACHWGRQLRSRRDAPTAPIIRDRVGSGLGSQRHGCYCELAISVYM